MTPATAAATKPASAARNVSVDVDLVRSYLRDIGRVPLLTHEQEITLGRQVQDLMDIEALQTELESRDDKPSGQAGQGLWPHLASTQAETATWPSRQGADGGGQSAPGGEVAKKYTKRNMELLDLIQEGTIGLVRVSRNSTPPVVTSFPPMPTGGSVRASPVQSRRRAAPSDCRFTSRRC